MDWFFKNPPAEAIWIAIICGVIGLGVAIMAAANAFQVFFGKQKLDISFTSHKGYKLWCLIRDKRINNKFLIWMDVERRSRDIIWQTTITDNSGKMVFNLHSLSISSKHVCVGIVEINSTTNGCVFPNDVHDKFGPMLNVGLHTLKLNIYEDNGGDLTDLMEESKQFQVNPSEPFVVWVSKKENAKLLGCKNFIFKITRLNKFKECISKTGKAGITK